MWRVGLIVLATLSFHVLVSASVLKDYRSLSKNFTSLLDTLLDKSKYDRRIRPDYGGSPLTVTVNMVIKSMGEVSEAGEHYTMDCYFRQVWRDRRLTFTLPGLEEFSLPWLFLDRVWKPDTFFINGKRSYLHRITVPNKFLRLREDGYLTYSMRLTIKASCPMHFRKFPLDSQKCPLLIGSYGYGESDVLYRWPDSARVVTGDVELAQYDLVNISTQEGLRFVLGHVKHSMIKAVFHMKRHTGYFILQVYVPCGLIVSCSWVSFWIDPDAVPARVQLGMTSMLSLTTMGIGARVQMPPVSYATALDWFIILCFLSVFSVVAEFAFIHYRERIAAGIRKILQERADKDEDIFLDSIAPPTSAAPQIHLERPEVTGPPEMLTKGKLESQPKPVSKQWSERENVDAAQPEVPTAVPTEDTALVTHITEQVQLWAPGQRSSKPPGDIVEGKLCIKMAPATRKDENTPSETRTPTALTTSTRETKFKAMPSSVAKQPTVASPDFRKIPQATLHYDAVAKTTQTTPSTSSPSVALPSWQQRCLDTFGTTGNLQSQGAQPSPAVRRLGRATAPYVELADTAGRRFDGTVKQLSPTLPVSDSAKAMAPPSTVVTSPYSGPKTELTASSTAPQKCTANVEEIPQKVSAGDDKKINGRASSVSAPSSAAPATKPFNEKLAQSVRDAVPGRAERRDEEADVEAGMEVMEAVIGDGIRHRRRREVLLTGEDDELEWQDELSWRQPSCLQQAGYRLCELRERLWRSALHFGQHCRLLPNEADVQHEMRVGKDKFSRIDTAARTICPAFFLLLVALYHVLYTYYITDDFPVKTHPDLGTKPGH